MSDLGVVVNGVENRFGQSYTVNRKIPMISETESAHAANPYQRFRSIDLILRDQLAIDRTVLANERSLLAYIRTGLALALTGAGCIKLLEIQSVLILGLGLIGLGVIVVIAGGYRFLRIHNNMRAVGSNN